MANPASGSSPPAASVAHAPAAATGPHRTPRLRRALLWGLLLALLAVAQTLLVALTLRYETWRSRAAADAAATEVATVVRRDLLALTHALQAQAALAPGHEGWSAAGAALLREHAALRRIEARDPAFAIAAAADSMTGPPPFERIPRAELSAEADRACRDALRTQGPAFSRSYFAPIAQGAGYEVIDLCAPVRRIGGDAGFLVATISLAQVLEAAGATAQALRDHELSFVEADGARLARAGVRRGAGVHKAEHAVDLPGQPLWVRADSFAGPPSLVPNLMLALVLGLSLALFALVIVLARDVRRRAAAEQALADALRFRKAMEDSLSTGLRARDLDGAITYVNPAFCAMVGYSEEELRAVRPPQPPPYWPAERVADYETRQRARLAEVGGATVNAGAVAPAQPTQPMPPLPPARPTLNEPREGFETLFVRKNGERFPAMVYEAPLLDGDGRQTGWMGAVVDLTSQRRIEDLSRQQQERLQASARLATMGEMASLLSHELNQPLAAIASYASGSLNLLQSPEAGGVSGAPASPTPPAPAPASGAPPEADATVPSGELAALLRQALTRIAEQAERAGRVIKSVHDFVRRREQQRESIAADALIEAVLPLVRLQARKSATQIDLELPRPPERMPRVVGDRTMLEQVLLNLARNGIQAMETETPPSERRLVMAVRAAGDDRVAFEVRDAGPGIAPQVAARLFTPFFTTRAEGMGLGLSLCRTVVEQHGGRLDFGPGEAGRGTVMRFTLPRPKRRADSEQDASTAHGPPAASALPPNDAGRKNNDTRHDARNEIDGNRAPGRRAAEAEASEIVAPTRSVP